MSATFTTDPHKRPEDASIGVDAPGVPWWRDQSNIPHVVVAVLIAAGAVLLLTVFGRGLWFTADDLRLIGERFPLSVADLMVDHNDHWSLVTILIYKGLNAAFGMNSYSPYLFVGVVVHLAVVALLFVVMVRARVNSWFAVAAASTLILFGPGSPLIPSQFQMPLAAAFGLAQFLLADHDGRQRLRDGLALLLGLFAIMTSGVGVGMVVGVGVAVMLRRGWGAAAWQTAPLALVYLVWHFGNTPEAPPADWTPSVVVGWFYQTYAGTFLSLGRFVPVAGALAVMLVVGLYLQLRPGASGPGPRRDAIVLGLLASSLAITAAAFLGRSAFGVDAAQGARFLYLQAVCLLPALALAATRLVWWRAAMVLPLILVFGSAVWHNAEILEGWRVLFSIRTPDIKARMDVVLKAAGDDRIPDWVRPDPMTPLGGPYKATMGFFREQVATSRLTPSDQPVDARVDAQVLTYTTLAQTIEPHSDTSELKCSWRDAPITVAAESGDQFSFGVPNSGQNASIRVDLRLDGRPTASAPYLRSAGGFLTATRDSVTFRVSSPHGEPYYFCQ